MPGNNLNLSSWTAYNVSECSAKIAALANTRAPEVKTRELLKELAHKLDVIRAGEKFDTLSISDLKIKKNYRAVGSIKTGMAELNAIQCLPDNRVVAIGDRYQMYRLTDGGALLGIGMTAPMETSQSMQYLPTGKLLLTAGSGNIYECIEVPGRLDLQRVDLPASSYRMQRIPDGSTFSINENGVFLHSTKVPGGALFSETDEAIAMSCLFALPDGSALTGSFNGTVRYWQLDANGNFLDPIVGQHLFRVNCIRRLDENRFVSCSEDSEMHVCDPVNKPHVSEALSGHTAGVTMCQTFTDGRIISSSSDKTLRIWRQLEEEHWKNQILFKAPHSIKSFQMLPDGRILIAMAQEEISVLDGDLA